MSHFFVFFCLGSDLGASGSPRLETLANESWSLELLFARISAQGVPLALTNDQNQFGVVFWALQVTFSRRQRLATGGDFGK